MASQKVFVPNAAILAQRANAAKAENKKQKQVAQDQQKQSHLLYLSTIFQQLFEKYPQGMVNFPTDPIAWRLEVETDDRLHLQELKDAAASYQNLIESPEQTHRLVVSIHDGVNWQGCPTLCIEVKLVENESVETTTSPITK